MKYVMAELSLFTRISMLPNVTLTMKSLSSTSNLQSGLSRTQNSDAGIFVSKPSGIDRTLTMLSVYGVMSSRPFSDVMVTVIPRLECFNTLPSSEASA